MRVFVDSGRSGSDIALRGGYQEMMEYVRDEESDIKGVIVYKSDRIHRKLKNLLFMIEDVLEPVGIAYIRVVEHFNTAESQGMLFLQMLGSFAEFERKVINERTKAGRVKKGENRRYCGGKVPYGYRLIQGDNLVIDEDEAIVVREIYGLKMEGKSLQAISDILNDRGYRTRSGGSWNKQNVRYVLRNRMYCGYYSYDGRKERNGIEFRVPRIVSTRMYNRVNVKVA